MIKIIQLKLSRVKYIGNSIGDDIRLEIEMLNQFLRFDKVIKARIYEGGKELKELIEKPMAKGDIDRLKKFENERVYLN